METFAGLLDDLHFEIPDEAPVACARRSGSLTLGLCSPSLVSIPDSFPAAPLNDQVRLRRGARRVSCFFPVRHNFLVRGQYHDDRDCSSDAAVEDCWAQSEDRGMVSRHRDRLCSGRRDAGSQGNRKHSLLLPSGRVGKHAACNRRVEDHQVRRQLQALRRRQGGTLLFRNLREIQVHRQTCQPIKRSADFSREQAAFLCRRSW